ncbi:aldehyde dehydrogenase family protein [Halomonas sp. 3H]|uniref:aldehyde dehydrogenase family protein n=1 Tax=Halomonas sp. 3H TaxID=2952527 RepID=UPI0020B780A3|nr:aldehyde dehydrogenase family protein [Halomonas sp. 3H]
MKSLLINGEWREASSGETLPVVEPSSSKEFGTIGRGSAKDVSDAVDSARAAYTGDWGALPPVERGRLLHRFSERILVGADELANIEARDTGKPMKQARADVTAVARYFEYYGGAADKFHGDTIPYLRNYNVSVIHEPFGVTGHIIPWNYPAQMFGRTLAPSLAVGNATVIKPAEDACQSVLYLAELALQVGFPPGAINVVTGTGAEAGAALAAHPGVGFVAFTGSPEAGIAVQKAAAEHFAPCVLELGGKSPQIVFEDADLEAALPLLVSAILQNAGQTCSAGSRVLIQESIFETVSQRLAERFRQLRVGDPTMDLDCGPLISARQKARVERFLSHAAETQIPLLAQGSYAEGVSPDGYYVPPTLLGPVPRDDLIAREEVFGPVLALLPFRDEDDAVHLANDTDFGLIASIWTRDGRVQQRMTQRLAVGQVFINCYGAGGGVELPFGGVKKSGHGREKGFLAMEEFCTTKTVVNHFG